MADKIEIFDSKQAFDDLGKLSTTLKGIEKQIVDMANSASKMNSSLSGLSSILELEARLNKVESAQKKATTSMSEYEKVVIALAKAEEKLSISGTEAYKNLQKTNKELSNVNSEIKKTVKSYAEQEKANKIANSAYLKLNAALNKLKTAYRDLQVKQELGQKLTLKEEVRLKSLSEKVLRLDAVLKKTDAGMGVHTRSVGNYSKAFDSLGFSVAQMTREAPAFLVSMNTGFMALSNNIPIFVDEVRRAVDTNKALSAEGKKGVPIWKQLAGALFSWQSLISAGIVLLTMYGGKLVEMANNAIKGAKANETLADKISEVRDEVSDSVGGLVSLVDRIRDVNISETDRLRLIQELKKEYPSFNTEILNERDNLVAVNEEIAKNIDLIVRQARAKQLSKEIGLVSLNVAEAQDKIREYASKLSDEQIKIAKRLMEVNNRLSKGNLTLEEKNKLDSESYQLSQKVGWSQIQYIKNLNNEIGSTEKLNILLGKLKENRIGLADDMDLSGSTEILEGTVKWYQKLISVREEWINSQGKTANINVVRAIQDQNKEYQKQIDLILGKTDANKKANKEEINYLEGSIGWYEKLISKTNELIKQSNDPNVISKLQEDLKLFNDEIERLSTGDDFWLKQITEINTDTFEDDIDILKQGIKNYAETLGLDGDYALQQYLDKHGETFDKIKDFYKDLDDAAKKSAEKRRELEEELANLTKGLQKEVFEFVSELSNSIFEIKINNIEKDIEANQNYYDNLISLAEGNEEEQERLEYAKEARDKELQEKKKEEEKKRFLFTQLFKLGEVAIDTAKAIAAVKLQASILASNPFTASLAPLALAQIPIILSTSAFAGGTILAQSIPAFKEGTKGKLRNDTLAYVGDGGVNEFLERDGKIFMTPKTDTLVGLKKDDIIHKDLNSLISSKGYDSNEIYKATVLASLASGRGISTNGLEKVLDSSLKGIKNDIKDGLTNAFKKVNIHNKVIIDNSHNSYRNNKL